MRPFLLASILSTALFAGSPAEITQRSAIFLMGPAGADQARLAARSAAATARRWLRDPGSAAELRRAGSVDGMPLNPKTALKTFDDTFLTAAMQARDSDPAAFMTALDAAAQALAQRPGLRLLAAVAENVPLSTDAENTLTQIIQFCQANAVRVVMLDPAEAAGKKGSDAWQLLGPATGGAFIRDPKALETNVLNASAESRIKEDADDAAGAKAAHAANAAELPKLPTDLPVHVRFIRTTSLVTGSFGTDRIFGDTAEGTKLTQMTVASEESTGPMHGLLLVESPINALHFDVDDNAGSYSAHARVTQIARDASGKIVWHAEKTVALHGPLKRMDTRKGGNLYYLRNVSLPAGRYTVEGLIEDLSAGKSGGVREALRTSKGLPAFNVSDAVIVRPFRGASDKLEADQILEFDGDAFSPMLAPVYKANEPFDLQIYFVLYPDLNGAQPVLSLEILRNGKVVGRSPLPFTQKLKSDDSVKAEGVGTGSYVSWNTGAPSMMGEHAKSFPYVATLRGARLQAGNYEGRVTAQQGNMVLSRPVEFQIVGDAAADVSPSGKPSATPVDDDILVTLPPVDPVDIQQGAALPVAEQQRIWRDAADNALSYSQRLPNFRCKRETRRLLASVKNLNAFKEVDALVEELTYENSKESYRILEVNGQKSSLTRDALKGVSSSGEFSAMLSWTFDPAISAQYKWAGRAMYGGALCELFDIQVPRKKSYFRLTFNARREASGFKGRIFVDSETGMVRRILLEGNELPKDFGLQTPTLSLEYGMARIGEQDYMLPLRSVLQMREGRQVVRNETRFTDYRKFEASSDIKYQ